MVIVSRAWGERERKNERVNERVWSRLTLLGPSDVVQRALLSVGWQDELVNDCPLRQNADFIFPTSDVCAFAAAFRSSVPPKYCNFFTWYRPVFTTNVCLFRLKHYFLSVSCSSLPLQHFPACWHQHTVSSEVLAYALRNCGSHEVIPLCSTNKSSEN